MSLARTCEACGKPVPTKHFLNVHVDLLLTTGAEIQDPVTSSYGEFCRPCVDTGQAVRSLLALIDQSTQSKAKNKKKAKTQQ